MPHRSKISHPTRQKSGDGAVTSPPPPAIAPTAQIFAEAAQSVFQTMLGQALTITAFTADSNIVSGGVSVLISLNGPNAGTMVLCLSYASAAKFVSALTGMDVATLGTSVVVDGVCELVNMVAGAAKAGLDATEAHFDMTLPVSAMGENITLAVKPGMPGGVVHCTWCGEPLQIGIWRTKEG